MGRYSELLRRPGFRQFLGAGAVAFAAPTGVLVVLQWSIVAQAYPAGAAFTGFRALALVFLGVSATLPTIAAALVSGTIADRSNRRTLMIATNLASLAAAVGIGVDLAWRPMTAVAIPIGPGGFYLPEWVLSLYPLWAVITVATTLFRPAFNASLPQLVPTAALGSANGLSYAAALAVSVGITPVAGALFTFGAGVVAMAVLVGLFAFAELLVLALPRDLAPPGPPRATSFLHDAGDGFRYLGRNRALLEITLSALAINFCSALGFVELGLYVTTTLATSQAALYGALTAGASVGAAVGTLLAGRLKFEPRAGRFLTAFAAGEGLTILALAFIRSIWVAIPDLFLFGLFPGMFTTVFLATVQATVPNQLLGRVLAADEVGSYALVPPGQAVGGLVTLQVGVTNTYLVAGGGMIAVGGLMATFGDLRRLGFQPSEASPAKTTPPEPPESPVLGGPEPVQNA